MIDPNSLPKRKIWSFVVGSVLLFALAWAPPTNALAQSANPQPAAAAIIPAGATPTTASDKITDGDIERLIGTLDDAPAREHLKKQLELLLQAQQAASGGPGPTATPAPQGFGAHTLASLSHHVELVSNALVNLVQAIADFPQHVRAASSMLSDPIQRSYWSKIAIDLLGVLALAFAAGWLTRRLLTRPRRMIYARQYPWWFLRLLFLPIIFVLEAMPILAFAIVSYIALPLFDPDEAARLVIAAIVSAQIAASLVTAIAAAVFAPSAPGLRLFRLGDETAAYLQVWIRRFAIIVAYGYAITELAAVLGIDNSLHEVIIRIWGLLVAAMGVIFVLQNRVAVADWIAGLAGRVEGPDPGGEPVLTPLEPDAKADAPPSVQRFRAFRRQTSKIWHILAIAYIAASYVVWSLQIEGGFAFLLRVTVLTAILLLVLRLADRFLRQVFDRSFALSDDIKRLLPGLETRTNRYLPVLRQTLLVVLYLAGVFALLQIWGLDMIGWLSEGSGRPAMAAAVKIVIVVALSVIASEAVSLMIEHYLRDRHQGGRTVQRSARTRTLLPLLRNAFRVTMGVIVLLIILSEIGVDIGPLLAAAGVVGLAVGFGAQTLVKDIITGIFILLEDTLSIGDVADLGNGHSGQVEGMTIRTIRLRDFNGSIHTVPFSSVATVLNMTKDYSFAVFNVSVAYNANVPQVLDILKEVHAELCKDPDLRDSMLEPIEIAGLDSFKDSYLVVIARIKTRPITQWTIMRAFNLKLKEAFERYNIEIPFPRQVLHVVGGPDAPGAAISGRSPVFSSPAAKPTPE